ncbi:lipoprotein [Streptomyces sviceus]|uniref:lipoprotein n=1 Tax=Streptomyces sviceus TaxID=285530 RepID=UPI0037F1BD3F
MQAPLSQGPVTLRCEIDAKPVGSTAEAGVSKQKYSAFTSGGLLGTKVEYLYAGELLDETKKETAFAVTAADGQVVVHVGGLDTDEHEEMLPAYELARRTLRVG